jgi:hypothetical protein
MADEIVTLVDDRLLSEDIGIVLAGQAAVNQVL